MSQVEFEDYHETSKSYDQTRTPVGIEILLGCFSSTPRVLNEQKILDAGCGTGNYLHALQAKAGHLYGLELNAGMLSQAGAKLQNAPNVQLEQGSILELPYPDETFDGVTSNQVLHHLETESGTEDFSQVRLVIKEAWRVLRSQGVFVINTSSQQQLYDGFWWADLIPDAVGRIAKRFPSIDGLTAMLKEAGFRMGGVVVPVDAVLQGENYLSLRGPLDKSFRDGDSTWSLATEEELERALERVRSMNQNGGMARYLAKREKLRKNIGQTTFVFAYK